MRFVLPIALILALLMVFIYSLLVVASKEDEAAQREVEKYERENLNDL